jgi:hypothetical protein
MARLWAGLGARCLSRQSRRGDRAVCGSHQLESCRSTLVPAPNRNGFRSFFAGRYEESPPWASSVIQIFRTHSEYQWLTWRWPDATPKPVALARKSCKPTQLRRCRKIRASLANSWRAEMTASSTCRTWRLVRYAHTKADARWQLQAYGFRPRLQARTARLFHASD